MRQRFCMALLFTAMISLSGCLGAISAYDDIAEDLGDILQDDNVAPELVIFSETPSGTPLTNISYDERVIIQGTIIDENAANVSIVGVNHGGAQFNYDTITDDNGYFLIDFGFHIPGDDYEFKLTAIDEKNAESYWYVTVTVCCENPLVTVTISALSPIIYAEEGSFVTAHAMIVQSPLISCDSYWIDDTGRNFSVSFDDGIATAQLGYIESSYNGSFTTTCDLKHHDRDHGARAGYVWDIGADPTWVRWANVSIVLSVEENPDSDGDGVLDVIDNCINSLVVFTSGPENDLDGDGCQDISEDNDDDSDNREDGVDNCARGLTHWDSNNQSLDWDSDGCHDESEDSDDDADSILDIYDKCPRLSQGWVSTITEDYDRDGCHDELDDLDDDDDSIPDEEDDCPRQSAIGWIPSNESDYDSDGCRDADEDGDDDNDGVTDFNDLCLRTILGSTVNEFGCAPYEWDSDNDGVMDDTDQCMGTPSNTTVNLVGCADLDGDGVFANVDQCPNSEVRWTADANGCTVLQIPIAWSSGPYSTERFGKVGDFTIQTKYNGNWKMSRDWDGESSYLFIMNQDSSSYMSSLWSQNVGRLLDTLPENNHIFFGSFDSDYRNDIDSMNARVNSYRNGQSTERQSWIDSHVHYIDQQGGAISGSFGNVINDWSSFYYGIDRFQQWREIGSLSNWAGTHGVQYRFDYIGKMAQQFNSEFPTEMRRHDPGVTVVDIMINHRHSGGWQGGHSSLSNGTFPNATEMLTYNTMEIYMHHGCSEHRDRYQKSDGSYGGCHEWDYSQYLQICDEVGNTSTCSREFGYWITTYGREGRWMTDISSRLFELQDGGEHMFRYRGANGGWLNVSVYLSTWDDDGLRPTSAEYAFSGGSFRGQYNNESQYKRVHDINIPEGTEKVEIYAVITGHGFGKDSANCAEFCNHEHRYSMNGYVTQEDHPMAGNSTIGSDDEGCAKQMHGGALANQLGSWPYGRAGWCAGQDVKPWTVDISDWINWNGGTNSLRYQGLYNGQNYIPQNEQSGANQNIHANVWIVYYSNISSTSSLQLDTGAVAPPSSNVEQSPQSPSGVFIAREEECTSEDD